MLRSDEEFLFQGTEPIFSVSEFIEYINLAIGRKKVVVEGEVSSFHINQGKWVFFDLKDEESKVSCFMIAYTLDTVVEDGMKVRVTGAPRVHGKSGKFSIFAQRIELHGEGALRKAFELTKKKLAAEGLFAPERKRVLPEFPEKIGLIASKESAAYTDFMRILNQRWGGIEVFLIHVHVQGQQAIADIVQAFEWFNGKAGFADALVLIRGGGSLEDLQAFNSEQVARAVFGSTMPVICGVGHEKDETLADYAADVRAATPTHAASIVVPDREEIRGNILVHMRTIERSLQHGFEWYAHRIAQSMGVLSSLFEKADYTFTHLASRMLRLFAVVESRIDHLLVTMPQKSANLKKNIAYSVDTLSIKISHLARNVEHLNPLTVLARGYSITRTPQGKIVKKAKEVKRGDQLDITFSDGSIHAAVAPKQAHLFH